MSKEILIEIASTDIDSNSGVSAKTGKPYNMRNQTGYVHKGEKYPEKISLRLGDEQPPYQVGMYSLAPQSFYVGQYDSLAVNPVLIEVKKG